MCKGPVYPKRIKLPHGNFHTAESPGCVFDFLYDTIDCLCDSIGYTISQIVQYTGAMTNKHLGYLYDFFYFETFYFL